MNNLLLKIAVLTLPYFYFTFPTYADENTTPFAQSIYCFLFTCNENEEEVPSNRPVQIITYNDSICNKSDAKNAIYDMYPGARIIRVHTFRTYFLVTLIYKAGEISVIEVVKNC